MSNKQKITDLLLKIMVLTFILFIPMIVSIASNINVVEKQQRELQYQTTFQTHTLADIEKLKN